MCVILATYKAQIKRIVVQSSPDKQFMHDPISKKTHHKKRAGGVTQGVGPKFKLQYCKN
jgi:hypothetical protein